MSTTAGNGGSNPLMQATATPVTPNYVFDPASNSYRLQAFTTPGCNNDFPDDPAAYARLAALWSQNVDGFTQQEVITTIDHGLANGMRRPRALSPGVRGGRG